MTRLIETQSKWGNLYNRRHYIDGRRVTEHEFSRAWLDLGCTPESGTMENTPYGFRTIWEQQT